MPASKDKRWFITLSTRDISDIDFQKVESLSKGYPEYFVVRELGPNKDHPHIHAYLGGNEVTSQENIRNRWKRVFTTDVELRYALCVKPAGNRDQLIGYYLTKEKDDAIVLWSNIAPEEVISLKAAYAHITEARRNPNTKITKCTLSKFPRQVIEYAESHGMNVESRDNFKIVLESMIRDGYDFINLANRMKYVYTWVRTYRKLDTDWDPTM